MCEAMVRNQFQPLGTKTQYAGNESRNRVQRGTIMLSPDPYWEQETIIHGPTSLAHSKRSKTGGGGGLGTTVTKSC